jgi:F-type H+-transporting ATPase subunit gamma
MSQTYERVLSRLNNLKAIEPLLGALRTISMGTWQLAQNKLIQIKQFEERFNQLLIEVLPVINVKDSQNRPALPKDMKPTDTFILIVGSERGLCGKFNEILAENAMFWISEQAFQSTKIGVIGSRMTQTLSRMDITLNWRKPMLADDLASYRKAYQLTQNWINQFESYQFNNLIILFNELAGENQFEFTALRLLPYETGSLESMKNEGTTLWPPAIIETNPKGIYKRIIHHYIASTFYQVLLRSAIAENSSRFLMMEEAKQNAQEIIEELNREVNNERKRQITQEMQELAVGAGLIDNK